MIKWIVEYFIFPVEGDLFSPNGHWKEIGSFNTKKEADAFASTLDWSEIRVYKSYGI